MNLGSFLAELKRRNVYKTAVGYGVVGWLVMQVAATIVPALHLPDSLTTAVVVLTLLGFPIALVIVWAFEMTPEGMKRTENVSPNEKIPQWSARKFAAMVISVALFAVALLVFQTVRSKEHVSTPAETQAISAKSIAVLPLFNLGGDSREDYLGDGISEEVLNALSRLHGLTVIGRASSFQFRSRDMDAAKVGRALNVRNLLSGTVQRAGDELRINIELIDTTNGEQLWSQKYDRTFKSLFALEDDISGAVIKALAVQLGAAAGQPLVAAGTASPHAHDLVLRAKQLSYRSDEASLNQSVVLFNQAIGEDPNYAAAWAGLVSTYFWIADAYRAPVDLLPVMKGAAEQAVALAPESAEAHAQLGFVLAFYARDFPAAKREMERAVILGPGSAYTHFLSAGYRVFVERDAAAGRTELRVAEKIDPLNAFLMFAQIQAAIAQEDSTDAEAAARRLLKLDPEFFYFGDPLVYAYSALGRWQECLDRAAAEHGAAKERPDYALAVCDAHAGRKAEARAILAQLNATPGYVDQFNVATIYAALGDEEAAFAALERAYRDHSAPLLGLWFTREFKPRHSDPRYQTLFDKIYSSNKLPSDKTAP